MSDDVRTSAQALLDALSQPYYEDRIRELMQDLSAALAAPAPQPEESNRKALEALYAAREFATVHGGQAAHALELQTHAAIQDLLLTQKATRVTAPKAFGPLHPSVTPLSELVERFGDWPGPEISGKAPPQAKAPVPQPVVSQNGDCVSHKPDCGQPASHNAPAPQHRPDAPNLWRLAPQPEHGQLDQRLAADKARQMLGYVQSFNNQPWGGIGESVDRKNLAVALDNLQETAAMLLNLSDRIQAPSVTHTKQITEEQWDEVAALVGCVEITRRGRAAILRELGITAAPKDQA